MRLLPFLLFVLLAGCAAPDPWAERDRQDDWQSFVVPAGQFAEIDLGRLPGQDLRWDWFIEDGTAVTFDVHRHLPDGVVYDVGPLVASEHAGNLSSEADTVYSLMWENTSQQTRILWVLV